MRSHAIAVVFAACWATAAAAADVELKLHSVNGLPWAGNRISATFTVTNFWGVASHIRLTASVDGGMTDVALNLREIERLGAPQTEWFTVSGTLPDRAARVVITAALSSPDDETPGNNQAQAAIDVLEGPDLAPSIGLRGQFDPEEETAFDIRVFNAGVRAATDVVLTIETTEGTRIVAAGGDGFSCDLGARPVTCRAPAVPLLGHSAWLTIPVRLVAPPLYGGGTLAVAATLRSRESDLRPADNSRSESATILEFFGVTTTSDDGPGSLRQAILDANAAKCTRGCGIGVRIADEERVTIRPQSPLPAINFHGRLRAPGVMLDGSLQSAGDGLTFITGDVQLEGIAVGNFPYAGVFTTRTPASKSSYGDLSLDGGSLGVDPRGERAPNGRGVVGLNAGATIDRSVIAGNRHSGVMVTNAAVSIRESRIESNGASGIYLVDAEGSIASNTIANNAHFGVAVAARQPASLTVTANSIRDNGGDAIDFGLDGPTPNAPNDSQRMPNHPAITSAIYDAAKDETTITVRLESWSRPALFEGFKPGLGSPFSGSGAASVDLYANERPSRDTQRLLATKNLGDLALDRSTTLAGTVAVKGDLRGRWITGVTRRQRWECYTDICRYSYETSEVSAPFAVQ